jgi:L-ascorbate metabolism protein UlaG (beta-lactamase superfamily)
MMRLFAALTASLLLTAGASAAEPGKVTIRWHGQSFFDIESTKGTRVVTDPHLIDAYGRIEVAGDLILISHEHNDHTQVTAVKNYAKAKVLHGLKAVGNRLDWNPIDETFRDVHVRTIGTYHDNTKGMQHGKNAIFVIDMDGLHIVHLGDLGHLLSERQVKEIGPVDILMIPVGGVYTLNGTEAKKVVEQLKPKQYILPMHYGTKAFTDLLGPEEFLDEQKNVQKLPTNTLVVKTDSKPAEPVIVLPDWK